MILNKTAGCALLITGTTIGAGMLGIPLSAIGLGYTTTVVLMLVMWVVTMAAAFLILEVNLADKSHLHFNTMASQTLGYFGQILMTLSFFCLLYALSVAYINGGSSLLSVGLDHFAGIQLSSNISMLIFTVVLGIFIYVSTQATDWLNRGLMVTKVLLLIAVAILCIPQVNIVQLVESSTTAPSSLWLAIPVFFTAFGYQTVIPSLTQYANFDPRVLKRAIVIGSGLSLVIYLLWQTLSFGIIPATGANSFATMDGGSVGDFIETMSMLIHIPSITLVLNTFAHLALITSFLGVTLCIFDFWRDILPKNKINTRLIVALITFVPPMLVAMTAAQGFTQLLSYAAAFLAVLACILPVIMVYKIRKSASAPLPFQVPGGMLTLGLVFLTGVVIIALVLGGL